MMHTSKSVLPLIVLICLSLIPPALAVDRNVPAEFPTIQAAVNAAASGDVIILARQTFTGDGNRDVDFAGKAVTIRSTDPNDPNVVADTVIDCQADAGNYHRAFAFTRGETVNSVVEGVTITRGWAESGGAIRCENVSSPTIRKCVITGNSATFYAGAIYCKTECSPTITQCTITNNGTVKKSDGSAGLDGGAIYCYSNCNPTISKCTFAKNFGSSGGAIYASNNSSPTITECTFDTNDVTTSGGAITCWGGHATIRNCLFLRNSANYVGGAVACEDSSSPSITNCTFYANKAPTEDGVGGAISCRSSSPVVKNSIVWDNLPDEIKVLSGTPAVTYCDIKGGFTGLGNINAEPLFADTINADFHLKSAGGRWDPAAQSGVGGWVIDAETSPCLDAGEPNSPCDKEPAADGQIVDMGHFGNTPYASKSPGKVALITRVTGADGTISPASRDCIRGAHVTLTATPSTGYRVKAWTGTDSDPSAGSNTNTVTMSEPRTVSVEFELAPVPTFTLSASVVGEHGSVLPTSGTYDVNTVVTLTATPDTGYKVSKWTGVNDPNSTTNTNTVTITENKTVSVEFAEVTYKLTTGVDGGHGTISPVTDPNNPQVCTMDQVVTLTATPDTGYRVKSWSGADNASSVSTINIVTMTADKTVKVTFEPIPYMLSLVVNGGHGTVTADAAGPMVGYDTTVTLTAHPDTGYRVKSWSGATTTPATGNNSNTVKIVGDTTVTVEFEPYTTAVYNLTASVTGGHGIVTPAGGTYDANTIVPIAATPDTGYRVKAWSGSDNDESTDPNNAITMSENKAVTVEFERVFLLTLSVTGGHGTVSAASTGRPTNYYESGETVALTATPESGYRVKAWSNTTTTPAAGSNSNTVTLTADTSVSVEFEQIPPDTHTLTVIVDGGHGTVTPISGAFARFSTVTLTAKPDTDYRVKSWAGTSNDAAKATTNSVVMDADKTVTVQFEIITYTLKTTAIPSDAGTVSPTEGTYSVNTTVDLTASPKTSDYRIKSWSGADGTEGGLTHNIVKMTSNKYIYVYFEPIPYTLTTSVTGGHGTLSANPAGPTVNSGTLVTLTATPDPGYRVKSWTGTDNTLPGSLTNFVRMTGNKTISVEFEPLPVQRYTLTATVLGGHGTVFPASGTYKDQETVMLTAIPDTGYKVKIWNNEAGAVGNSYTLNITSDRTITVEFEKIVREFQLTTSVVNGTGGTLSPVSGPFTEGTKVTLKATPEAGYRVKAWTNADIVPGAGSNDNTITMSADKTVSVEFEAIPTQTYCALLVNIVGQGTVSPVSGKYFAGDTVTLLATPTPGYHVKSWSGTNDDTSTATANAVTMSANKTVTLTFEKDAPSTYLLTISIPTGHGIVSPAGGVCLANSTVRLSATPDAGYRVKSWSGTLNTPATGSTMNQVFMDANKTVAVEFEEIAPTPALVSSQYSTDPNVIQGQVAAVQQMIPASGLCGAGALTFLPLCIGCAFLLRWTHEH